MKVRRCEVAIQLVGLLPEPAPTLVSEVSRLSVEEPLPALQMAALQVLERVAPDLLVGSLVEVYADHGFGQGSPELLSLANQIMQRTLTPEQVLKVQEGIEEKKEEARDGPRTLRSQRRVVAPRGMRGSKGRLSRGRVP